MELEGLDLKWVRFTLDSNEIECQSVTAECHAAAIYAAVFHPVEECYCNELYAVPFCYDHGQVMVDYCYVNQQEDGWIGQDDCQYNHEFISLEPMSKYEWNKDE